MQHFLTSALGSVLGQGLGVGAKPGWLIGSLLAGTLFGSKAQTIDGERLEDREVQSSTYGRTIPIVYGRGLVRPNIIWASRIAEDVMRTKHRVGLFSKVVTQEYRYHVDLALGLCAGECSGLIRLWANDQLIYDASSDNQGALKAMNFGLRYYPGSETQMPDPLIEKHHGKEQVPAFRGLAYVVLEQFPLAEFNNKIPRFTAELSREITPHTRLIEVEGTGHEPDNIYMTPNSRYVYLREGNVIVMVDRATAQVEKRIDLTPHLPRTDLFASSLFGHLCLDEMGTYLYAFAQHQLSSFIVKIDAATGLVLSTNFADRVVGDEVIGCVRGQILYSGDFLKGTIRSYHTSDLGRIATTPGGLGTGLHQRPCNFTHDAEGRLWLLSLDPLNNGAFYLTRMRGQNVVDHYSFTNHGTANQLVFDQKTGHLWVLARQGLVRINPDNGEVMASHAQFQNYQLGFVQSTALNHARCDGLLWLVRDGAAHQLNLETLQIIKQVQVRCGFQAAIFDEVQHAFWVKERGLVKIPLDRCQVKTISLPHIVQDILGKAGYRTDQIDVNLPNASVHGYVIDHPTNGYEALKPLQMGYDFFVRAHEEKLQAFQPRTTRPIQINRNWVNAFAEGSTYQGSLETQMAQGELPTQLDLIYPEIERNFGCNIQTTHRLVLGSNVKITAELPILMTRQQAQQTVAALMDQVWLESQQLNFTLPPACLFLEVGDVLTWGERVLLVTRLTVSPTQVIEVEGWFM